MYSKPCRVRVPATLPLERIGVKSILKTFLNFIIYSKNVNLGWFNILNNYTFHFVIISDITSSGKENLEHARS